METLNQNTPYNTTQNKILNSISLEHNQPLVENVLGRHPILLSDKREAMSDPSGLSTTQLLHKPIVFANNISWSVDQEINATVHTASLLSIFETLNRSPGGQNLRGNAFFRSGAKIELKLTSSPFHSGKLVFYYVPPGVRTQFRESIYSKVQFPCVYVDAANSTTGMLNIPFVTLKDFFSTYVPDDFSDFGDIVVAVLNPLRIGTGGPTSVQLALTLHPTQNDICLPILAHDINIEIQGGFEEYLEDLGGNLAQMFMGGSPDEVLRNKVDVNTPQIQNILHNIHQTVTSGDATKMPGLPPQSVVAPPMSNLDKPTQGNPPPNPNNTTTQTKVNNSAPTLSNPTGITTEHLSLVPEKTVIIETPNQEMNLLNVAKIPSLIRIGEWMDSQNSGAILFKTPIEPMVCPFLPSANTTTGVYYPTYLSHVTAPFAFWNGSIDYHISFAGTEQHKGKVIAAWLPFDRLTEDARTSLFLGRDPTIEELSLYPNEIFDLSLNKEFSFSVPYNSETPFRYVPDVNYQISTVDGTPSGEALSDYSLGIFYLAIYNKLSHPTTVSSTINYNVYIKAGPDYSLHGLQFSQDVGNQYQKINYITLQGLDLVYESTRNGMANEQSNRIGISQNTIKSASFQSDNSEHNLGVLLQKYYPQFAYRVEIEALDTTQVTIPSLPGLNFRAPRNVDPTLFPDPRWRNLIAHFRDIYAFWQGSLNYFIIHNTTVNNPLLLSVSHDPTRFNVPNARVTVGQQALTTNAYYVPVRTSTPLTTNDADLSETSIYSHISNLRVNPTIEITTPHRSLYRRLYTADSKILAEEATEQTDSIGNLDLTYSNPSADNITASAIIYQSIGDDFQFKYIIPPPSLKSRR